MALWQLRGVPSSILVYRSHLGRPHRLPLSQAVDGRNRYEDGLPAANWINYQANLARNVLPKDKKRLITAWLKKVSPRLKKLYPLIGWDRELTGAARRKMLPTWHGPPVPREALDPNIDYTHDMADDCLARFLEGLDHKNNPFLHSPKHMIDAGFEGTPYTWPAK